MFKFHRNRQPCGDGDRLDEAWAAGLVMAGVFAWILAFPWFGPLGPAAHGHQGFPWPYVFGFAHGAGFLVFSHPAWRRVFGYRQVFVGGLLICVLTAVIEKRARKPHGLALRMNGPIFLNLL